jgi:hypothetical protein
MRKQIQAKSRKSTGNDEHFFSALTETERKNLMETLMKLAEIHKLHNNPIE